MSKGRSPCVLMLLNGLKSNQSELLCECVKLSDEAMNLL